MAKQKDKLLEVRKELQDKAAKIERKFLLQLSSRLELKLDDYGQINVKLGSNLEVLNETQVHDLQNWLADLFIDDDPEPTLPDPADPETSTPVDSEPPAPIIEPAVGTKKNRK